jgi:hypothetical protein
MRKLQYDKEKPNCNLSENNPALKKQSCQISGKKHWAMPYGMAILLADYQMITSLA